MGKQHKNLCPEERETRRRQYEEAQFAKKVESEHLETIALALAQRWLKILEDQGHHIYNQIGSWISDKAINGEAFEEYDVDLGYDISTYAQGTGRHHKISNYETVGNFLDTPNGQTIATHISGHGLAPDTLLTDFEQHCLEISRIWLDSQPEMINVDDDQQWSVHNKFDDEAENLDITCSILTEKFYKMKLEDVLEKWPSESNPVERLLPAEDPELPIGLATLLDRFPSDLKDHHLTFITPTETATFASDNAQHLKDWWAGEAVRITLIPDYQVVLHRRVFTSMKDITSGIPIKKLSSYRLTANEMDGLSADEVRHAFTTDHETGQLEHMAATVYEAF